MSRTLPSIFAKYVPQLQEVGIDQAEAELELILCHLTGVERLTLYLEGEKLLTDDRMQHLDEIVRRRRTRYPLQYILGNAWFYGRQFAVNEAVMVPTPETELLCETAIKFVRNRKLERPSILDVGVGSGVIAVTLAAELDSCRVVGLDVSPDALAVAENNARSLGVIDSVELRESDFFSAVARGERFDLILSNPPYIPEPDYDSLPPEVLADPKRALTSGPEGLDAIKTILREAPGFLAPGGRIMFEIGEHQADRVSNLTDNDPRYKSIVIVRDLNDRDRVIILSCE